jgi:hypothetical protein
MEPSGAIPVRKCGFFNGPPTSHCPRTYWGRNILTDDERKEKIMYYSYGELVPQTPDEKEAWSEAQMDLAEELQEESDVDELSDEELDILEAEDDSDPDDASSFEQLKEQMDYENGDIFDLDDGDL